MDGNNRREQNSNQRNQNQRNTPRGGNGRNSNRERTERNHGGGQQNNVNSYCRNRNNRDNSRRGGNRNNERTTTSNDGEGYRNDGRNENRANSNNSNFRSHNRRSRKMGFKALQELIENDNVQEIMLTLFDDKNGFKLILEDNSLTKDMIVNMIKLFKKICESPFDKSKTSIFNVIVESTFPQTVTAYISMISLQNQREKNYNKFFWNDTDDFWNNIIAICKHIHDLIPLTGSEATLKILKAVKISIPHIEKEHNIHISDDIKNRVEELYEIIEKNNVEVEAKHAKYTYSENYYGEPPNDFRDLSVYPSSEEIIAEHSPFLRPNVIEGPYMDVTHYLDVQYRLLREDFVTPLRKGISMYLENPQNTLEDIKIYKQVKFLNLETFTEQNCYRIKFDFSKKKKSFEFENSKRFMFGSLLCFTHDNFKTIFLGKIAQRDIKDLEIGEMIVEFSDDVTLPLDLMLRDFLMVESKVYFEPYYQVLTTLKEISTEDFPMERYIIDVNTDKRPPEYLIKLDPVFMTIENTTFCPLDWNDRKFFDLNDSQNDAFQAAITSELAIIQGPPGTGKTFIGLKIAETLLKNKGIWYTKSPMLVICYTNHALDQFLEGLLCTTENIIRVGGQSKNKRLDNFNLRNKRFKASNSAIYQKRIEVKECLNSIKSIDNYLKEIKIFDSVVDFSVFRHVSKEFNNSWFSTAKTDDIIAWLLDGIARDNNNGRNDDVVMQHNGEDGNAAADNQTLADEGNGWQDEFEEEDKESNEMIDDLFKEVHIQNFSFIISIKKLQNEIEIQNYNLREITQSETLGPLEKSYNEEIINFNIYMLVHQLESLKENLAYGHKLKNIKPPDFIDLKNPYNMPSEYRWQLYFYWLSLYKEYLQKEKQRCIRVFKTLFAVYREMRDIEDARVMQDALVIGMTTTGAARLHSTLQALKNPIVIVEEAAEVLEAHIITALTASCKHLILIGDHKQLKPSAATFQIETKYLLGISLFERMIHNKIQCHTLNIQHRMRPDIANLVRPSIYEILHDHPSVENRPDIVGMDCNLFFLDHQEKEQLCNDNSKRNIHESKFMIQLAKRLLLNGYKPENIVILAAYLGQMFEMKREKQTHGKLLKDIRIAVLDNYQGEESDIILLSLVRNNKKSKIGFLKIENRVCVALSRARNGFYVMGNMTQLCTDGEEIWPQIRETLRKQNAIGEHLTLRCQIHKFKTLNVNRPEDFSQFPEGGCDLMCDTLLGCGHTCKRLCHIVDRTHEEYNCKEKCEKLLCDNLQHICQKRCYQECGACNYPMKRDLNCGHSVNIECHQDPETYNCMVMIEVTLPCDHLTRKPCHMDPIKFPCPFPCESRLQCGHACTKNCHIQCDPDHLTYKCIKECTKPRIGCTSEDPHLCTNYCFEDCQLCSVTVLKKRTICNHMFKVACSADPDEIECTKPCKRILSCGHKCSKTCNEPCEPCHFMVEKVVPDCNHNVKIKCFEKPTRDMCSGECSRLLNCGHLCGKKCNQECRTRCKIFLDCHVESPCGHIIRKLPCYNLSNHDDDILLMNCTEKCTTELKCKHVCSGTCGTCFQGRVHERCQERCGATLVCGHECTEFCREACKHCNKPCEYSCKHSKCPRKCGEPCMPCKENCSRHCKHQKCKRKCGDICSVPPCNHPCDKFIIKCGHKCVGFCGDPCPKLCRICDTDELTEIFFGTEEDEDARFVLLEDCNHLVESIGMEEWLKSDDDEIKMKVCPKCKTLIKKTDRYSDFLKQNMVNLTKVKNKIFGNYKEIRNTCRILKTKISTIDIKCGLSLISVHKFLQKMNNRLESVSNNRRQVISQIGVDAIRIKLDLLDRALKPTKQYELARKQLQFVTSVLERNLESISLQEIEDIELEIDRLQRCYQYQDIIKYSYDRFKEKIILSRKAEIESLLKSPTRYSKEKDDVIKSRLNELKRVTGATLAITDTERRQIIGAMGLKSGHWYKCPKGHVYVITECGGAMEVSKCPDCGAEIGGRNHSLLTSNQVATEMDGARFPAWSEQENMLNYAI